MKPRLYLETTIPSYLVGRSSRDLLVAAHQLPREWWERHRNRFELYVSELVLEEVPAGDAAQASLRLQLIQGVPNLPLTRDILELDETLVREVRTLETRSRMLPISRSRPSTAASIY